MKLAQIAFIAVLGTVCLATYATSKTLHAPCALSEQAVATPALTSD